MRITIPDDLGDLLDATARAARTTVDALAAKRLAAVADIPPGERLLVLRHADLERLELTLNALSIKSVEDLHQQVERVTDLRIGGVKVKFTPAQLEELRYRAEKNNRPIGAEIAATVQQMVGEFFNSVPAAASAR